MLKRFARIPAGFFLAVFLCIVAFGQENTATIYGTVTDPSGAAIPGVKVSITNDLTGRINSTTSNEQGQFTFNFLPIGTYSLSAEQTGFQSPQMSGVTLVAGQKLGLTVKMVVAAEKENVTVSAEEPLIQTSSSDQLATMNTVQVQQLPLPKEDWTTLLTQQSGANFKSTAGSGVGGLSLNGLPPAGFSFTIDGTNASNDPEAPTLGFYQSPNVISGVNNDAIAEVSVVKGIAPATVSSTLSGNVNVITRSGTNNFHGDAYEINDPSVLDARNWFVPESNGKPRSVYNQFGGALGGPIVPNKVFFFGSYQGVRASALKVVTDDVPTPYLIANSPSVYSSLWNVYPSVPQPAGDPTALTTKYTTVASTLQDDGNALLRMDFDPTQSNVISARYLRSRPSSTKPNIISINPRVTTGHSDELNASWIHTGGGNWTSSMRFGYNRLRLARSDLGLGPDLEQVKFGFDSRGSELFNILGSTYSLEESIALNRGRHAIQIGGILQRLNDGRIDLNTATVNYSSLSDFQNNIPNQVVITFDKPEFELYTYQFGGYFQDDFRVSSALTLNLGLRYDYFTVPKEASGLVFNRGIDPNNPQLGVGYGPYRNPNSMYNADRNNFGPRFGFAWGLGENHETVIRGGSGIFVSPHPIFGGPIEEVQNSGTVPFRIYVSKAQALQAGLKYPVTRDQYDAILQQLQTSGAVGSDFANTAINPNFPNPYSIQWMIGVERQLPWGLAGSVNYVGTRGLKLNLLYQENLPDRETGVSPYPPFGAFRLYTAGEQSIYHSLQINLQKHMMHGLLFNIAYTYATNYSLASANLLLENPPQDNNNVHADWGPTPFAIRNQFSANFVYDLPFLQWAHASSGVAKQTLGGWEISGVLQADDGSPWNITNGKSSYPSDRPNVGSGSFTMDDWRNTASYKAGTVQFLNKSAFASVPINPASGAQVTPGNLGRNAIWGPGTFNIDATVRKVFKITEQVDLMIHSDFLNVLNHPNFSGLVADISKGTFGQLTSATNRQIQIGARIRF